MATQTALSRLRVKLSSITKSALSKLRILAVRSGLSLVRIFRPTTYPTPSAAFLTAIDADTRDIKAKIVIDWVANFTDADSIITSSGQFNTTYTPDDQAVDGLVAPNELWLVLGETDLGSYLLPESGIYQAGWYTDVLSLADRTFTSNPWLKIQFPTVTPLNRLMVFFEPTMGQCAEEFYIEAYDASVSAWKTVSSVVGNTSTSYELNLTPAISNITQLRLTIVKWSVALVRAKLMEFEGSYSVGFDDDSISKLKIRKEREFSTGTLPIGNASANDCSLELDNTNNDFYPKNSSSPYYNYLGKENRRVHVWLGIVLAAGSVEWLKQGVFYTKDWIASNLSPTVSIETWDYAKKLMGSKFSTSTVQTNQTVKWLVENILGDSGLSVSNYNVENITQQIPYYWSEPVSHWEALKELAEATGSYMYFDELGVFQFESRSHLYGAESPNVSYDADVLPQNAIPAWTRVEDPTIDKEEISPAGFLHIKEATSGGVQYLKTESTMSTAKKAVLEVRARLVGGTATGVGRGI